MRVESGGLRGDGIRRFVRGSGPSAEAGLRGVGIFKHIRGSVPSAGAGRAFEGGGLMAEGYWYAQICLWFGTKRGSRPHFRGWPDETSKPPAYLPYNVAMRRYVRGSVPGAGAGRVTEAHGRGGHLLHGCALFGTRLHGVLPLSLDMIFLDKTFSSVSFRKSTPPHDRQLNI